jgi:hypothetical protein
LFEGSANFQPTHAGQHEVENNDVWAMSANGRQSGITGSGHENLKSRALEVIAQQIYDVRFIFHN